MEAQKATELTIEEEDKEHLHLPLLVSSRCVSSRLDSAVKRCSSEVLKLSFQRGCLVKGLARRVLSLSQTPPSNWIRVWRTSPEILGLLTQHYQKSGEPIRLLLLVDHVVRIALPNRTPESCN